MRWWALRCQFNLIDHQTHRCNLRFHRSATKNAFCSSSTAVFMGLVLKSDYQKPSQKDKVGRVLYYFQCWKDCEQQKNDKWGNNDRNFESGNITKYLTFPKTEQRNRLQLGKTVLAWEMFQFYSKYCLSFAFFTCISIIFSCTATETHRSPQLIKQGLM